MLYCVESTGEILSFLDGDVQGFPSFHFSSVNSREFFPPLKAHSFDIKYFINITFNKLNRTSQERLGRGDVELAKQNRIFQFQGGTISKGGNIEFLTHINYSFAQFDSAWMEVLWKFSHFIDSIFSLRALSPSTREPSNRTHNTLTAHSKIHDIRTTDPVPNSYNLS